MALHLSFDYERWNGKIKVSEERSVSSVWDEAYTSLTAGLPFDSSYRAWPQSLPEGEGALPLALHKCAERRSWIWGPLSIEEQTWSEVGEEPTRGTFSPPHIHAGPRPILCFTSILIPSTTLKIIRQIILIGKNIHFSHSSVVRICLWQLIESRPRLHSWGMVLNHHPALPSPPGQGAISRVPNTCTSALPSSENWCFWSTKSIKQALWSLLPPATLATASRDTSWAESTHCLNPMLRDMAAWGEMSLSLSSVWLYTPSELPEQHCSWLMSWRVIEK